MITRATQCFMSTSPLRDDNQSLSASSTDDSQSSDKDEPTRDPASNETSSSSSSPFWQSWLTALQQQAEYSRRRRPPPLQVEDTDLVFYDVFLLCNLVLSVDFWVIHRMQMGPNLAWAVNEASLLSLCWMAAGLWNGAFLRSAMDGNWPISDERAGPLAAARLAMNTFVNTINIRLLVALATAVLQHRPALQGTAGEDLLPLELGWGLLLMPAWRWLHSSFTPRV